MCTALEVTFVPCKLYPSTFIEGLMKCTEYHDHNKISTMPSQFGLNAEGKCEGKYLNLQIFLSTAI
jgi:hypothetical protein